MDPSLKQPSLEAPWRMAYLESLEEEDRAMRQRAADKAGRCFLREYWLHPESDEANHVVHRDETGMILLNKYPYANGHLLVALGESRPALMDYEPEQRAALWVLVEIATDLVQRALEPQGINIGVNQGRAAGAGVPEHLHVHVVPRWGGDTNFITVVGRVRVMPTSLEAMAARYRRFAAG